MKICMYNVTTAVKVGGIETYYWEVSKCLQNSGQDVTIVTGEGSEIKYPSIPIKQFPFRSRYSFPNWGDRFIKFAERISFYINARKYIKANSFDAFLVHKPFDFFVCYFVKKYHPNTKTIFMSGGEDFYKLDHIPAKSVDFMFAVSKDNAERISSRYSRDVKVIPNGVDVDSFTSSVETEQEKLPNLNLPEGKKVVISIGRVVRWKGCHLIIEALAADPDLHYLQIGDGPQLQELKALAEKLKVADRVSFLGRIEHHNLPKYLNRADVFVQPSVGHEAFGITVIEALACGVPVVASNNGGMKDIIENDLNGYLFETENVSDMVSKINAAYENRPRLSAQAVVHVKEHFTWSSSAAKLVHHVA